MRISSSTFANDFLYQTNQLQQQQNTLQQEVTTGQKVTLPEDNPSAMAQVLNLQTSSASNSQYQSNVTALQSSATTSYGAMNSLKTISDRVSQIATLASSGTTSPSQLASYSSEVKNLLQEAVQIGNTQDAQGNYIFGGTNTGNSPFTAVTDASGNITGVTYNGNTSVASSEIAPNVTISAQTPGANTSGAGPTGLFQDSRSGANLFANMISLQQNLASGNTAAINSTDVPALATDENNIITNISANGVLQSTLTNATNIATAQSTNLTSQISGLTNADLATALTRLNQTQTAYQAALESGTQIMQLSILNYLQ